jgi:hypothetical protein
MEGTSPLSLALARECYQRCARLGGRSARWVSAYRGGRFAVDRRLLASRGSTTPEVGLVESFEALVLALLRGTLALVGQSFALISYAFPLIGVAFPLVGLPIAQVGEELAGRGLPVASLGSALACADPALALLDARRRRDRCRVISKARRRSHHRECRTDRRRGRRPSACAVSS